MSYAIFRSKGIKTLNDLSQIGSHNKRDKKAYKSNKDINIERSNLNYIVVPCNEKYIEKFYEITKDYRSEHNERMKTMRSDRKKSFYKQVNDSKGVVADELLFTSDKKFFYSLQPEDIKDWADTCMDFIYNDLGYSKEQIIHAVIHFDEKTPHLHCVVVPLTKKIDKRAGKEKYSITKREYIKSNEHLSELQDRYHEKMLKAGFNLDRGIKNSDMEHIPLKEYKRITKRLDQKLVMRRYDLNEDYAYLQKELNSNKYKKNKVVLTKEVYVVLTEFLQKARKYFNDLYQNEKLYKELSEHSLSYKQLEQLNDNIQSEVNYFQDSYNQLKDNFDLFKNFIRLLLQRLKDMFKKILHIGNDTEKEQVITEIKEYYNNDLYDENDLFYITENTSKENEINYFIQKEREYE